MSVPRVVECLWLFLDCYDSWLSTIERVRSGVASSVHFAALPSQSILGLQVAGY